MASPPPRYGEELQTGGTSQDPLGAGEAKENSDSAEGEVTASWKLWPGVPESLEKTVESLKVAGRLQPVPPPHHAQPAAAAAAYTGNRLALK